MSDGHVVTEGFCGCVVLLCSTTGVMTVVRKCRAMRLLMGEIAKPEGWELLPHVSVNDELERHYEDIRLRRPLETNDASQTW